MGVGKVTLIVTIVGGIDVWACGRAGQWAGRGGVSGWYAQNGAWGMFRGGPCTWHGYLAWAICKLIIRSKSGIIFFEGIMGYRERFEALYDFAGSVKSGDWHGICYTYKPWTRETMKAETRRCENSRQWNRAACMTSCRSMPPLPPGDLAMIGIGHIRAPHGNSKS